MPLKRLIRNIDIGVLGVMTDQMTHLVENAGKGGVEEKAEQLPSTGELAYIQNYTYNQHCMPNKQYKFLVLLIVSYFKLCATC